MDTKPSGNATEGRTAARRDRLTFDHVDYLGTSVILGIAVVGSILDDLAGPVLGALNNAPLPISYATTLTGLALPRGARLDGDATVHLLLTDATLGERLTQALPQFLVAALTIAAAWLLFQLLRSVQDAEPFTRQNVWRVNVIALIVGIGGTLTQLAQGVADNAILSTGRLPDPGTLTFAMTFTPLPLVVMLVIALFGEAFRRGVVLRQDVEGLV